MTCSGAGRRLATGPDVARSWGGTAGSLPKEWTETTATLIGFVDDLRMIASNAPPGAEPPETGRSAPAFPQRLLVS